MTPIDLLILAFAGSDDLLEELDEAAREPARRRAAELLDRTERSEA